MEIETHHLKNDDQSDHSLQKLEECEKSVDNICRICLEGEKPNNILITPCFCSGSMKYVHEECLKIWLLSKELDINNSRCDICKSRLSMNIKLRTIFSFKHFREECVKIIVFPIMILLVLTVLTVIILYLVRGISNDSIQGVEEAYIALILILCSVILFILVLLLIRSIRLGCLAKTIKMWVIQSRVVPTHINETTENLNVTENFPVESTEVIHVPLSTRFQGREVTIPRVSPISLRRIQHEDGVSYFSRSNTSRSNSGRQNIMEIQSWTPRT